MNYEGKYIKYKTKYLHLKHNLHEINNHKIIIHISGAPGSGKTTLGNKLKKSFGDTIIVKDIDDLRDEFIKSYYGDKRFTIINEKEYQKYIDDFVNNNNKTIIFVGVNNMPWWHKNIYYNMHSQYNFYIDIDDETILKQKCLRFFKNMIDDEMAMNDLINNNDKFVRLTKMVLDKECNMKNTLKENNKWKKDYKNQEYEFMSRENIYDKVNDILTQV